MSFQGLLAVITKTSKEFFRQRWSIPFIIGFPVFFFLMFGIAFGGTAGGTNSIAIGVFDTDNGILGYFSFSEQYNDLLDSIKYPNSTVKVFQVSFFDNELALRRAVQSGVVGIGLVIPEDFSYTILSAINQSRFFASGEFSRRSDLNIS
ncbi:MAG TPA: ABC transporter permease, partial [Candidatus Hodarchaeales archaeon]|nr:ABC transporter permease [Candidatus Hodarchaeales archaeon]